MLNEFTAQVTVFFNRFSHSRTKNLALFFIYTFANRSPKCSISCACKTVIQRHKGASRLEIQGMLHLFELFHP